MIVSIDHINKIVFSLITIKIFYQNYFDSPYDLKDLIVGRFLKYFLVLIPFYIIAALSNIRFSSIFESLQTGMIHLRVWNAITFYAKLIIKLTIYIYILSNIPNYIQYNKQLNMIMN